MLGLLATSPYLVFCGSTFVALYFEAYIWGVCAHTQNKKTECANQVLVSHNMLFISGETVDKLFFYQNLLYKSKVPTRLKSADLF